MQHRAHIHNEDQMMEALKLAIALQNSGIATSFAVLHGHVNHFDIHLRLPAWTHGASHDEQVFIYGRDEQDDDTRERNEKALERLRTILETGKTGSDAERLREKEREIRRQQYEELNNYRLKPKDL